VRNLSSGFSGGGDADQEWVYTMQEESKREQNIAKKQTDGGGVSDHRNAVAMCLKGRDSSLDSFSPSFNGGL